MSAQTAGQGRAEPPKKGGKTPQAWQQQQQQLPGAGATASAAEPLEAAEPVNGARLEGSAEPAGSAEPVGGTVPNPAVLKVPLEAGHLLWDSKLLAAMEVLVAGTAGMRAVAAGGCQRVLETEGLEG